MNHDKVEKKIVKNIIFFYSESVLILSCFSLIILQLMILACWIIHFIIILKNFVDKYFKA